MSSMAGDLRPVGKAVDPARHLPEQLLSLIVDYLTGRERGALMSVASHYQRLLPTFATGLHILFHHVGQVSLPHRLEL